MSATPAIRLLGEVESPRPLRAQHGLVSVRGWCFLAGVAEPPAVRLTTDAGQLAQTARHPRPDLHPLHASEPAAAHAGFVIEGHLPAGVHLARFEARLSDGSWQTFRTLSLAVESIPLAAGIDAPAATGTVTKRVHVEGWAFQPDQPVSELSLRYGHQEIPCDLGRPRPDLARSHPASPHAAKAGFKSRVILSAGRGPVRLKARLADGSTAIARTLLQVDVRTDENHPVDLDFSAPRVPLTTDRRMVATPAPARSPQSLNVLFVLPGSFASNSALHAAALANELVASGHEGVIAVPHDVETLAHHPAPAFRGLLHAQVAESSSVFSDDRAPDIIHAWTTRENVRRLTETLRARHGARVVVHLEDNEQELLALSLGRPAAELARLATAELDRIVPADLSHPHRAREFLAQADGVTHITGRLAEFIPSDRPRHLLWPAADARWFGPRPRPDAFRHLLDRRPGETVLFYHGNVHAANAAEVRELYLAVLRLNQAGEPVTLIRTGRDSVDFLGPLAPEVAPHVLCLGQLLHHHHLPPLMALADIFVQPGRADAFNDYRFPSKLPEFFALGRPVILPRTNLGTHVRHDIDAYVLDQANAAGIATAVSELRSDPDLHQRLSQGARAFAERHFSWRRSAEALMGFYRLLTTR
ncbi:glycosyltransferase [Oleiharenicola lentus]|uniref:Glycosyltransferase n=1 Tax=Oleiharenicola lentus TaxID=2508720 RepID=A0A4Q1C9P8_9BACT|nr:glycosyltransferase family 4 protein [Oleiharenicola lentus]RXK55688.1 glycosyltransferase [Oleiharenicola lentus]